MKRVDNYKLQAEQAKQYFLRYDQTKLIRKLKLEADGDYLYAKMLCKPYRVNRTTGNIQRMDGGNWTDADTHAEVMTLLDLVCDSREDRYLSCRWKNMLSFGQMFHQNLMEDGRDAFAEAIQDNQKGFRNACAQLDAVTAPGGDMAFAIELFDGLCIAIQFWEGDEEFSPRVRYLWDENARMYLKYETMWYAIGMLKARILEEMKNLAV